MKTAPRVNTGFKKLSDSSLKVIAAAHRLGLLSTQGALTYPDAPYDPTALASLINAFNTALATAYKGTKADTIGKNSAKKNLQTALQQNAIYINSYLRSYTTTFGQFETARLEASYSGLPVNKNSTPAGPLQAPMIRAITSPEIGQIKIVLNKFSKSGKQRTKKIRGTAVYEINYRKAAEGATPAGPWITAVSSAYFSTIASLDSGDTYDIQIYAKGANAISAPTTIQQITVL